MPAIAVQCDDAATARWVDRWLADGRLSPPAPLTLAIEIADLPPGPVDTRPPYLQPTVEIRSGPPLAHTEVRWRRGAATALLPEGAGRAHLTLGGSAATDMQALADQFLTPVLVLLLRRAGWHHVHAATAVDPSGRGWLLAGDAEDGKSTTAARLATLGWSVGGDDLVFLAVEAGRVVARPRRAPIALRPGGMALLGRTGGTAVKGGRKSAFFPEELGGSWAERVVPEIVAFPRIEGTACALAWMPAGSALAELVRWSAWVVLEPQLAQTHLDLLALLARQARAAKVRLAEDLFAPGDRLMELSR